MKSKVFFLTCLLSFSMIAVHAQKATPKVRKQQVHQQRRINQGVRSGELTRKETRDLKRQQRSINRSKRRAKSDGVVTKGERVRLRGRQRRASKNIRRKKNNQVDRN